MKCEKPTITYSNGKLKFSCSTEEAVCQSTITNTDIKSYSSNEVQLGVTYNISVYATKAGYENSETATATLCWIVVEPKMDGIDVDAVMSLMAQPVLIQSQGATIIVQGAIDGTPITIHDTGGKQYGSAICFGNQTVIKTNLTSGSIAIVKIGEKSIKVKIR